MRRVFGRIIHNTSFVVVVLALVAAASVAFLHHNRLHKLNSHFSQHQDALAMAYQASIQMYRLAMEGFYTNMTCHPDITRIFAEGVASSGPQRDLARGRLYRLLYPQYQAMQHNNLLQLHFHQADNTSYLRFHKPDRHGDSLSGVRNSVQMVNAERRPVHGFETGRVRSGFRYVYPVSWDGHHVGSVEVSVTTKGIRDAMAELDSQREYAFLLNRRLIEPYIFEEQKWLYRPSGLHPEYILEDADALLPDSPPPLCADAKVINLNLSRDQRVQQAMRAGEAMTTSAFAEQAPYIVSLLPIHDVKGQLAGYLVTYALDRVSEAVRNEFIIYLSTAVAALGLIAVLLLGLRYRTIELDREQHNLKVVSDTLAEGVFVLNQKGIIRRINPAACRMLGYAAEEMIGQNAHAIFHRHSHNEYIDQEEGPLFKEVSHGQPYDGEEHFQRRNGSMFVAQVASRPIRMQNGWVGSVVAFHDITERKSMEEELREKEALQRTLMESLPIGLIIIDARTRCIERINPTMARLFGAPAEEIVGHRCHQYLCPSRESNCPVLDHGLKVDSSDRVLIQNDGSQIPVLKTVNRITIKGEEKLLECVIDIRNRIAAEKALRQANFQLKAAIAEAEDLAKKAEKANQAKSEFLANMSHELRTPLNHIIGFTDLILSREFGELTIQQDEFLKDVLSSGQHLLALINDVLDLSKVEAGQMELQLSEVRIRVLLEGSLAMVKENALKHKLRLTVDLDGVPEVLQADECKLKQIVYNLLSNAVKFTPPGGEVRLGARIHTGSAMCGCPVSLNASEIYLCVWVSDTGIGISPQDLSRIFDPFEQADGSATRNYQGTGLGLALTRKMVELHAGAIWAESGGAGQGSTFKFAIPA